ncbi:hypothetical protein HMPREF3293_01453 [Christensenella minuta]|uniref:Uncharacterized protein n=1 Tax=Christensenella minuta TaxID=626937 RepID=A0A136Q4Y4_9FIRM|nr:hypothetical protein HMPREF3293_01453 [Christensenella minuta]
MRQPSFIVVIMRSENNKEVRPGQKNIPAGGMKIVQPSMLQLYLACFDRNY